jgi:hypothetical protein
MSLSARATSDRRVILCEVLTGAWCIYMASRWMHLAELRVPSYWLVPFADRIFKACAALTLAWAVWRLKPWAWWGVILFAAYMGIPHLDHLYLLVDNWFRGPQARSVAWSTSLHVAMASLQLVALATGLTKVWASRPAA